MRLKTFVRKSENKMRKSLVALLLSEIYYLSGFSNFWLAVVLIYFIYTLSTYLKTGENEQIDSKSFFLAWPLSFLFGIFLFFPSVFLWPAVLRQIYLIAGLVLFDFIIKFYKKHCYHIEFFRFFSPIVFLPFSFLFFRSNLFSGFFFKEIIFFLSLFLLFESYRQIFSTKKTSILITFIPVLVLLEFAWILNFLPVNFLSLGAIWLILFVLINELWILNAENQFNFRYYLPEIVFALILVVLILISSSWRIIYF